jgi:hypothetical protein
MEPEPAGGDRRVRIVPITTIPIGSAASAEPRSADGPDVDPATADRPEPAPLPPSVAMLLEQAVRIAIGMAADVVLTPLAAVLRVTPGIAPDPEELPDDEPPAPAPEPGTLLLLAGAGLGFAMEAADRTARVAGYLSRAVGPLLSFPLGSRPVRAASSVARGRLEELDHTWRQALPPDREAADAFLSALLPEIVRGLLRRVDLTGLIVENVDLDRVIGSVDVQGVLDRVDIDDVVARVDMDAIVRRIDVEAILHRVDVNAIVERVDVDDVVASVDLDGVVARIDMDAIVRRIDVVSIAQTVIDELDIPALVRDSSATMATETVGGIRVQAVNADRVVARAVDRMLFRRTQRSPQPPEEPPEDRSTRPAEPRP